MKVDNVDMVDNVDNHSEFVSLPAVYPGRPADSREPDAGPVYVSLLPWDCDGPDTSATISEAMQDRLADLWADILVADYRARHAIPDAQRTQP